ncbi:MAG TPA: UbiA family prenyltransferase [Ktedonobacteraceae bacterium]|nr:UbiA family prenyltransferase [Ktedonobacteraceae bacterium]
MQITKKRTFNDIILGFFLLSHPIPVLFHIIAVTIFTLLAAWPHFTWSVIVLVITAHAAMQVSIAMLNDYCDRMVDARGKPEKPIPRGLILPREALVAGLLMIAIMLVLLIPLPRLALVVSLCYLALGQAYNLGLKSTPLSGIVFALAMPLIPLYAFAGVGHIPPIIFWFVPAGFLLGIALNLANSLPDLEEDAAQGLKTLAVVLGVRRSFAASYTMIIVCTVMIGVLAITGIVSANPWIIVPVLSLTFLAVVSMMLFFGPTKARKTRKTYFYFVTLTCIWLAGGWLIGVLL